MGFQNWRHNLQTGVCPRLDGDDGEEPQFWNITLAGSHSLSIQMTPSHIPWSLPGMIEIRASWPQAPGLGHDMLIFFAKTVIDVVGLLLSRLIATEDEVPDWLAKCFASLMILLMTSMETLLLIAGLALMTYLH